VSSNVSHLPVPQGGGGQAADAAALEPVCAVVEGGGGLLELVRTAARSLGCSLVLVDRAKAVLAVAARSPAEEHTLITGGAGVATIELRVADEVVGQLRARARGTAPPAALLRAVALLTALEVERVRGPDRASRRATGAFLQSLLTREITGREDIVATAGELGVDLASGGMIVVVRAHHLSPAEDDWRARLIAVGERAARATAPGSLVALRGDDDGPIAEIVVLVPEPDEAAGRHVAGVVVRELEANVVGVRVSVGLSRLAVDPVDLHRAGNEALLAANVAEGDVARPVLAFEETGAYRLLLPAMSEDPAELERFFAETLEPIIAYDTQYETDLVQTLETYLESDGNVAGTAQKLYTHRHTVRYRLERVRELSGHDVGSSEGREKLSLGLKAMRVLGIPPPRGPASESGAAAGRVPREAKDRL
jgi:sugar diacid utilization regulator